jgi:hypothetical protein
MFLLNDQVEQVGAEFQLEVVAQVRFHPPEVDLYPEGHLFKHQTEMVMRRGPAVELSDLAVLIIAITGQAIARVLVIDLDMAIAWVMEEVIIVHIIVITIFTDRF